nr:RNA-directed DNA polymerase, eukaryota [Tanacetum cinerariifolium]
GHSNEELVKERTSLLKELHNINKCHSLDMAQKAKVRWAIEGDQNSKFFHGIINKKRSQFAICGILIEGDWIDKPCNHFQKLSAEQIVDLECDVTYDEIKKDCGTNKSPDLNGFTFDFVHTFWQIINQDVVNAVREFFISNYGPSPFRVYHSWFNKEGFVKLVNDTWNSTSFTDASKIIILKKKLQALKISIKSWCKEDKQRSNKSRFSTQARISDLDKLFDRGHSNEELVKERTSLLKELHNINKCHSLDMAQKAKVRWAIEG